MINTLLLPKSKYSAKAEIASQYPIKNIIETIHIEGTTIEIEAFYDTLHKGNRYSAKAESASHYSCSVKSIRTQFPTGHHNRKSFKVCGGYGKDNQITHPTYESILLHALQMAELGNDIIRDFKLKLLLE